MWDHPWAVVATTSEGTRLPPPLPILPAGFSFICSLGAPPETWIHLVGTHWTPAELAERLEGAWIACLSFEGALVATCVLRPHGSCWILETLVSRKKGSANWLLRCAFRWLWDHVGPTPLFFTWELSLLQLAGTFWKGWWRAIRAVHSTWIWSADCFCHHKGLHVNKNRFCMPTVITDGTWSVTVSDSGLEDGWGYVLAFTGSPDWPAVAAKGGWLSLWTYGARPPGPWGFTSQVVVMGAINYAGVPPQWASAEVASS